MALFVIGQARANNEALDTSISDLEVVNTSGGRTLYPATKAAMDYLGLVGGGMPRPPLRPLEGAALKGLHKGIDKLITRHAKVA